MSVKPLPEDRMLCRFWPTIVSIAHLGKADEALEFVREVALLEGKLHLSIVPGVRQLEARVAAAGFVGRPMDSRFAGTCEVCRRPISIGAPILYNSDLRRAAHDGCGEVET